MKKNSRQINRILATMLMSMVVYGAFSQTKGDRPTLMVGIVIDQLRSDYIDMLKEHFGEDGFNRLIRNGAYFENASFDIASPDIASGTALLYTGAYPNANGITQARVRNRDKKIAEKILVDPKVMGNFTAENLSPNALALSTFCDESRVASSGLGYVYSFAADAQQSIIMAGHAANGAFWINDEDGKWSTTTFYKDVPSTIQARNYSKPLSTRLDTMSWRPLIDINKYASVPTHRTYFPFRYFFGKSETNRYRAYKQSALVNEEVASVAIDCIQSLSLGKRGELDIVNIGFTAAPYTYGASADYSVELQDTYLRIDQELARIFHTIDKTVGFDNAVVFVASTGYFNDDSADEERFKIPTGKFYPKRAVSLLNMFLIAKYGNGDWLNGYYDGKFYFNAETIKQAGLDIADMRKRSAEFLRMMSGVEQAYALDDIVNNPVTDEARRLNRSINMATAADVYMEILPGWSIVQDEMPGQRNHTVRSNAVNCPILICAPEIKAERIKSIVDASILAPTVSKVLRIRSPNGAFNKPYTF